MTKVSQTVLFFLVNATWQVTWVVLLASVGDRILRNGRARYRHALWVAALALCVALPLFSLLCLSPGNTPASLSPSARVDQSVLQVPLDIKPSPEPRLLPGIAIQLPTLAFSRFLVLTIAAFYALLLLYRGQVLLGAWAHTRTLVRSAQQIELPASIVKALERCRHSLNFQPIKILSSTAVAVPVTAGTTQAVLILPKHLFRENDVSLLISALGHEGAHILRRDYLWNLAFELASLSLWFHPAMRLLQRRIRQTRELCCDEMVTERLLEPRLYAQSLVQLAGAALTRGRPAPTIAAGFAGADILEERIMRILKNSPVAPRRRSMWPALAVSLLAVPCLAAGAVALRVAVRQPAVAVANNQTGGPASSAAAQPDSGQQPSPPAATPAPSERQPKSSTPIPDGPRRSEAVVVVAEPAGQTPSGIPGGVGRGVGHGVSSGPEGGATGGVAGGVTEGADGGAARNPPRPPFLPSAAKPKPGPSDIKEGNLIRLIEPEYPKEAKAAGIQGDVVLEATIGKTGDLENLRVISGNPIFSAAAMDALKQWKHDPYTLNGEPVEMETTIRFEFRLGSKNP